MIRRLREAERIRAILEKDRCWALYALGDLDPERFSHCEWFGLDDDDTLVLLYRGFDTCVLYAQGAADAIDRILSHVDRPRALQLHVRGEALPAVEKSYAIRERRPMWRMILPHQASVAPDVPGVVRLHAADMEELTALYADGLHHGESPDFFLPAMLETGVFYGVREQGRLTAAAGTHLVSSGAGVAAIGNIYTLRSKRGNGLGRRVTAAVLAETRMRGIPTIGLNVAQTNLSAVRLYEGLGFQKYCQFFEGLAEAR
jgi:ribosomal protein S18 acetylase RimI-like enzyme